MVWRASIEAGAGPHSVCVCVSSLVVRAQCADCRRPWLVPFTEDVSPTMVAISAVLGALLALLFFVEQVSVLYATLARDVGCVVVTVRVLLTSLAVHGTTEHYGDANEQRVEPFEGHVVPLRHGNHWRPECVARTPTSARGRACVSPRPDTRASTLRSFSQHSWSLRHFWTTSGSRVATALGPTLASAG